MKKSLSARDALQAQCIKWYRVNGNHCEISVWKVIRLVLGHHGMAKLDETETEAAARYAKIVFLVI